MMFQVDGMYGGEARRIAIVRDAFKRMVSTKSLGSGWVRTHFGWAMDDVEGDGVFYEWMGRGNGNKW